MPLRSKATYEFYLVETDITTLFSFLRTTVSDIRNAQDELESAIPPISTAEAMTIRGSMPAPDPAHNADNGDEGDENDEGNELDEDDENNEGVEGDEGDEGNEGDEPVPAAAAAPDADGSCGGYACGADETDACAVDAGSAGQADGSDDAFGADLAGGLDADDLDAGI
ncbi:hypothetical protein [Sedimentitalea sp.]|uniref:hypothetical protein n=1 Tax=Sedimentitalea sp. TaxID=2048915 RepID=UPI00329A3163